jgi:DNA-binding CsgD family transcriptional regulator
MTFGSCLPTQQWATVTACEGRVAVSIGAVATDPIDPLPGRRSRSATGNAAALLVVGVIAAFLELRITDFDHGTHLLVVLTLVIGAGLLFGRGPATTALAVGGAVSTTASVITVDNVFNTPHAYVQLLTYLLAGAAFVVLIPLAARTRRQAASQVAAHSVATPQQQGLVEGLTARELDVLRLAATGISVDDMADRLFVSPNTVKTHLTHIYAKLGVRGRSDAVRAALHCGCLTPADICPHLLEDGQRDHRFR